LKTAKNNLRVFNEQKILHFYVGFFLFYAIIALVNKKEFL